jgi:hypothetical protein
MNGYFGDLQEPEFPMIAALCPLKTQEVMEAVGQAAAGGTASVIVAIRMDRDPAGRDTYHDVPVAVILGAEDFRSLARKDRAVGAQAPVPAPALPWPLGLSPAFDKAAQEHGMGHWSCLGVGGNSHWIRRDGIYGYLHDREQLDREVPMGEFVFGTGSTRGWLKDPAPTMDPGPSAAEATDDLISRVLEDTRRSLSVYQERRNKELQMRLLLARILEWFDAQEQSHER